MKQQNREPEEYGREFVKGAVAGLDNKCDLTDKRMNFLEKDFRNQVEKLEELNRRLAHRRKYVNNNLSVLHDRLTDIDKRVNHIEHILNDIKRIGGNLKAASLGLFIVLNVVLVFCGTVYLLGKL